jgi:hypothetical protein
MDAPTLQGIGKQQPPSNPGISLTPVPGEEFSSATPSGAKPLITNDWDPNANSRARPAATEAGSTRLASEIGEGYSLKPRRTWLVVLLVLLVLAGGAVAVWRFVL